MDGRRFNINGKVDWEAVSKHLQARRKRHELLEQMPSWVDPDSVAAMAEIRESHEEDDAWEALEEIARMRRLQEESVRVRLEDL